MLELFPSLSLYQYSITPQMAPYNYFCVVVGNTGV
jgi:hypothetical protein